MSFFSKQDFDFLKKNSNINNRVINTALKLSNKFKAINRDLSNNDIIENLKQISINPTSYLNYDSYFCELAQLIKEEEIYGMCYELRDNPLDFKSFINKDEIEESAYLQMQNAMRLPITLKGALMPDVHTGYGLPIGGVLATTPNTIIPYAVGVDIACRMRLTVLPIQTNEKEFEKMTPFLKDILIKNTLFGTGGKFDSPVEHEIFDREIWSGYELLMRLFNTARCQLGTSGTGNHFVEFGIFNFCDEIDFIAILSHSGSRALGANIANYYSDLAKKINKLPKEVEHLAWLDLETETGMEYFELMNFAGDYAKACHDTIHNKIIKDIEGFNYLTGGHYIYENHHNFAWLETLTNGEQAMVHRKGATPSKQYEMGVIPGNCVDKAFLVRGKGNNDAINSCSHGAGRAMSRGKSFETVTKKQFKDKLIEKGVTMIGGDLDEAPQSYKDIYKVIEYQKELVDIIGVFTPKIVRMAEPEIKSWRKNKVTDILGE